MAAKNRPAAKPGLIKAEDLEFHLRCASGARATYREEVWVDRRGAVVKYNLAFIQPLACQQDNGRLLGYDNAHGYHERHFMGRSWRVGFVGYEQTLETFQAEMLRLKETT